MQVQLKKWSAKDKMSLYNLCSTADRTYLPDRLPSPYTEKDAEFWLDFVSQAEDNDTDIFRAIVVDGRIVGSISVECKNDIFRTDSEIGFMVMPDYRNQGIATKAVAEIVSQAFNKLNVTRITAYVFEPNLASAKVLEKNGFVLEGRLRNAAIKGDKLYNILHYGLVK
ncbi:MAG: GNAT family N-acetyltransferase [Bacteroidales bacterium]|nr:GNAT family N-acetyltransferase [Bacteroidales bacterium]